MQRILIRYHYSECDQRSLFRMTTNVNCRRNPCKDTTSIKPHCTRDESRHRAREIKERNTQRRFPWASQVQGARLLSLCGLGWQDVCIIESSSRRRWSYRHTATDRPIASPRIVALRETSSDRARSWIVLETRAAQPLFDSSALHSTFSLGHSRVVIPRVLLQDTRSIL